MAVVADVVVHGHGGLPLEAGGMIFREILRRGEPDGISEDEAIILW
jgi:hypothetical protein